MRRYVGVVCLVVFGSALLPAPIQAQTGTIAGVVKDSSGAVLPGVSVEAASPALIEQVDFRLAKNIRAGRLRVQPQLDLYNMFNANPVLTVNSTYGPNWQNPTSILSPRLVKAGVQVDF